MKMCMLENFITDMIFSKFIEIVEILPVSKLLMAKYFVVQYMLFCKQEKKFLMLKKIEFYVKEDTVGLQKQLQMYVRTKGLSVIARLQCIGRITTLGSKNFSISSSNL